MDKFQRGILQWMGGIAVVALFALCCRAESEAAEKEFVEKPVNPLFLKSMSSRPWWEAAYRSRLPILVTEPIGKNRGLTTVDFICDFNREVDPASIRVVTPWEEEVRCQALGLEKGKIEILFQTTLRPYENKPFLIYFDNPNSLKQEFETDLIMRHTKDGIEIRNEMIQVVFTANNMRPGKIKVLRIIGSQTRNQLLETATGIAWGGFELRSNTSGGGVFSKEPVVKVDEPFKKTLCYTSDVLDVEFTVYSFSPRIDYKLIRKRNNLGVSTETCWTAGGATAYDMFYYEGLKGPMSFKAGPDFVSDSNDVWTNEPKLGEWMREGWAAVSDVKVGETVGEFFDRKTMKSFSYYGHALASGERFTISYENASAPSVGALVAMKDDWKAFRSAYLDWKNPPIIHIGKIQAYQNIMYKRPDLTKDFVRSFSPGQWRATERQADDYAEQFVLHIRQYGANTIKWLYTGWNLLPLSKDQYETLVRFNTEKPFKTPWKVNFPPYKESMLTDSYMEGIIKAAHAKGLSVKYWQGAAGSACFFGGWGNDSFMDKEVQNLDIELSKAMAKIGVDLIFNPFISRESPWISNELHRAYGSEYWKWANPEKWLDVQKIPHDYAKRFYHEMKKDYPDVPVNALCTADGELERELLFDELAPYLDTAENEFIPGMLPDMFRVKYGIKRMHGIFGNDGRTIEHHFYYYFPNPLHRVSQMELPMMFGIKSFAHEVLSHENNNPELIEITADFYRLTDYTTLGDFIARTTPYKYMGVFRDSNAFRDDIMNKRTGKPFSSHAEQDGRCRQLTALKNTQMDVIFNRFFTASELKKYPLIFIPSDRVFSDSMAKELQAYVEGGGRVISEGHTVNNPLFAQLAGVKKTGDAVTKANIAGISMSAPVSVTADTAETMIKDTKDVPAIYRRKLGAGMIVYSPYLLTDDLNAAPQKRAFIHKLIVDMIGSQPIIPAPDAVNALDSSLLANGKEYFYGVYNPSGEKALQTTIKLNIPVDPNSFLLNAKTGERVPFTGTVKTDIVPYQTGFYIIGSDTTTTLPEIKAAPAVGGCASETGMNFIEKREGGFAFEFTPPGKPKTLGVLRIAKKQDYQNGQVLGAEAIYGCLREKLKGVNVQYLVDLKDKTLNGCDVVIVPNMGPSRPSQLDEGWGEVLRNFAKQGGGVMLVHHAIGISDVGQPPFPSIGKWSGEYFAVNDFKVVGKHPVTEEIKDGEVFHDQCWDYDQVEPGEDGVTLAVGQRKEGSPTPALVAGKFGDGNVVVSGIGIGCGGRTENGKYVKYEAAPAGGLEKILVNAAKWLLKAESMRR